VVTGYHGGLSYLGADDGEQDERDVMIPRGDVHADHGGEPAASRHHGLEVAEQRGQ
jgi:hypothetical protein